MKRPSPLARQQCAVGRILHKSVLKQITRTRRYTLLEQKTGLNEAVQP